jgi:hypothetical protein
MVELESFPLGSVGKVVLLEVLNSFSPRFIFFIVPVKREGSIDPFFGLLDSPDKNVKML